MTSGNSGNSFNEIRNNLSNLRQQRNTRDSDLYSSREALRNIQQRKSRLERLGLVDTNEYQQLVAQETQLQSAIPEQIGSYAQSRLAANELLNQFVQLAPPQDAVENLDDGIPILLFPVRIETRFMKVPQLVPQLQTESFIDELWVRIYPDDIQVETHEECLTEDELVSAQEYWKANWRAGGDEARELGAWRALVRAYSSQRAAWIISEAAGYRPTNPEAKPTEPLEEDEELTILPEFPPYEPKQDSWSRAPRVKTMPDRFVVIAYSGNEKVIEVVGNPIPEPLIVGPDPTPLEEDEGFIEGAEDLRVDRTMEWMVDFEQAVQVGMGLKIPLTGDLAVYAQNGFDRLLVLGLRLSSDQWESKSILESLIDNHHYSEGGFSLVPQGTNTNNTEAGGSGFSTFDLGEEASFRVELLEGGLFSDSSDWKQKRDGQYLAEALGINSDVLKHIQFSDSTDQRDARAINTALWTATLGYFMDEMMHPVFSQQDIRDTREFFIRYISGRGALPAIRVDNQPYGILPTSAFSRWVVPQPPVIGIEAASAASNVPFEQQLLSILLRMDQDWGTYVSEVSYAGKSGDSAQVLLDMLGLHASSVEYHQRFAIGIRQLSNLLKLQGFTIISTRILEFIFNKGRQLLSELGYESLADSPEVLSKLFFKAQTELDGPLIDEDPISEITPIKSTIPVLDPNGEPVLDSDGNQIYQNYIQWLASKTLDEIRREDFGEADDQTIKPPKALLYLMLRHAMMQTYYDTAINFYITTEQISSTARPKELELMYVRQANPGLSRFHYLYTNNEVITQSPNLTVAEYVSDASVINNPQFTFETQALREVREALDLLGDASTARLARAFSEHVDLCSYRLDAWKLGLVNQRLESLRQEYYDESSQGIYLGAFGWVEDLRPKAPLQDYTGSVPEEFSTPEEPPLKIDPDNAGYIHGPSLNHAVTAAVLRNAYLTHAGQDNNSVMAVNLSSERVRMALSLIDGVRNGQELGALLGYQFERGLHERYGQAEVDKFIYPLRKKFPLVADELTESEDDVPIEAIEARNVIDGLRFLEHVRNATQTEYPYGLSGLPEASPSEKAAIEAEVDRLANMLDAVGDLALAESVYQVAQGNYERAGAMLKAITEGNNPADPDIVNTPRSGFAITQRLTIQFETEIASDDLNPFDEDDIPLTPRAKAEPGLNKWLASILGDPADIVCRITQIKAGGTEITTSKSLEDLQLQPIDFLYIIPRNLKEEMTELDARIAHAIADDLEPGDRIRIEYTQLVEDEDKITFFQILPLITSIHEIVADSRPLNAEDLILPSDGSEQPDSSASNNLKGFDLDDIRTRVTNAYNDLVQIRSELEAILADENPLDAAGFQNVRNQLMAASLYGIQQSIPETATGQSEEIEQALRTQAATVLDLIKARTDAYDALDPTSVDANEGIEAQVNAYLEAGNIIMGSDFKWMPTFRYTYPLELQLAVASSNNLVDTSEATLPLEDWLHGVARVRDKAKSLEDLMLLSDNFGHTEVELTPIQLPHLENDSWLALEFPADYEFESDKLLITTYYTSPFDANKLQAGLLIDEWVELVPTTTETTGIAFHYDRPNTEPPQTLLLAVSPNLTGRWEWDDLLATLNETLDMAKKRAVEPEQLDNVFYSQFLPAIMIPVTKFLYTLSTNLAANVGLSNSIANIELIE